MALFEDVTYSSKGVLAENSFMQYKIPSRMDVGTIRVEFESSYEPTGPFGAKSIGEIVINTPAPAIARCSRQCDRRPDPRTADHTRENPEGNEGDLIRYR